MYRNLVAGSVVNGDVTNGEMSGELTPSSDADSVSLDASSNGHATVNGKVFKQDIITITGRKENCEAAREAMLVCSIPDYSVSKFWEHFVVKLADFCHCYTVTVFLFANFFCLPSAF